MKPALILLTSLLLTVTVNAQTQPKTQNVVLITLDGIRWQDAFRGADSSLLFSDKYMKKFADRWRELYWDEDVETRRERLMPFLWGTLKNEGQIFGNRDIGSEVSVKNPYNISYPGYSEIFTGYADKNINSNNQVKNPNPNFMEYLSKQPAFRGKVAAFASWDRFPFILNEERSGFMVNGGYEEVQGYTSDTHKTLNAMQNLAPRIVSQSSRPDYVTYFQAKEYMRVNKPRVISIGLANTDDMAHDGNYGFYLDHVHAMDAYVSDMWEFLQSDPFYKDQTTLFITVDHGRGEGDAWTGHGKAAHSNEIWFAVAGPGIPAKGEVKTGKQLYQNQFAQTLCSLLGVAFKSSNEIGDRIEELTK
jgi:hypothetical protein